MKVFSIPNKRAWLLLTMMVLSIMVVGCSNDDGASKKRLPNPTEKMDGYIWIPIADLAFLIQGKTWLKSYGRKSTDGMIEVFSFHATAPDFQPWSAAVHDDMYPKRGHGKGVVIHVRDRAGMDYFFKNFPKFPQSSWGGELIEEKSEVDELYKFRAMNTLSGKVNPRRVYYQYVENNKVKYFIRCSDTKIVPVANRTCWLSFPFMGQLKVELTFARKYLPMAVAMADKATEKLVAFEAAGRLVLLEKQKTNLNKE